MNRSTWQLISLLSVLLLLSAFAFGQAISGDLVGVVKDTTGAYVPNAECRGNESGHRSESNARPPMRRANIVSSTCLQATTRWR